MVFAGTGCFLRTHRLRSIGVRRLAAESVLDSIDKLKMLAALVLHLLANTGQDQQAEFEQILLQARILQGEESTYELSKVVWSPDGKWGGYTISETRKKQLRETLGYEELKSLCLVSADHKTVRRVYTGQPFDQWEEDPVDGEHSLPSIIEWSPDGRRLLFYKYYPMGTVGLVGGSLHDLNPRTGKIRTLTAPYRHAGRTDHLISFYDSHAFSPDGKELLLLFGHRKYSPDHLQIAVLDYHTLARRWLTRDNEFCIDPEWSPDGRHIAFSARAAQMTKEESDFIGTHFPLQFSANRLWVVSSDGKGKLLLTDEPGLIDDSPEWVDDETIHFVRMKMGVWDKAEIWQVKIDGTGLRKIKDFSAE